MGIISTILGVESGGQNVTQGNIGDINNVNGTLAQGYFQITDPTWAQFGGLNTGYTSALQAPYSVQESVAENIPVARWGPDTQSALASQGYSYTPGETLGQMLSSYGQSGASSGATSLPGATNLDEADLSGTASDIAPGSDGQADFGDLSDNVFDNSTAATTATSGATGATSSVGTGAPLSNTDYNAQSGKDTSTITKAAQTDEQQGEGWLGSWITAIANYTSSAFIMVVLIVVGAIVLAIGLGMFKSRESGSSTSVNFGGLLKALPEAAA